MPGRSPRRSALPRLPVRNLQTTDDWVAAGFVNRVAVGGVRIPDDLRVVVGCHRDQLQTILADCDCLVLDPPDVARGLIKLLELHLTAPDAPDEIIKLPYQPVD